MCTLINEFQQNNCFVIQLYNRMKCMGVCLSHRSTLNAMDKLGNNFDSHVYLWKAEVTKLLLSAKVECIYIVHVV